MSIDLKLTLELHAKWLLGEQDGKKADLSGADLSKTNLSWANLSKANLSEANLSEADLDFSFGWQFHCHCSQFTASAKQIWQILAHVASLRAASGDEEEIDNIKKAILPFAKKSHRASDLGILLSEK